MPDETPRPPPATADALSELLDREGMRPEELRTLLAGMHPVDLADLLLDFDPPERAHLLEILDVPFAAQILEALDEGSRRVSAAHLSDERFLRLSEAMEPDLFTDLLQALPAARHDAIIARMKEERRETVRRLARYPPHTAGGRMNPNFLAVPDTAKVADVLAALRTHAHVESADFIYAVDASRRLTGAIPLRSAVTRDPATPVREILRTDIPSVPAQMDQEEVARTVAAHDLAAIPVVDECRRLLGIVTVDDVIDVIHTEASEDMLMGAGGARLDPLHTPIWRRFRLRWPWLTVTLVNYLVIALFASQMDETIRRFVILAAFMPLIMAMAGNVGLQSSTVMIRALALGQLGARQAARAIRREFAVGVLTGLATAVVAAFAALALAGLFGEEAAGPGIPLVVGASSLLSVTFACTWGAMLPVILSRSRVDPALACGPLITALNDLLGVATYLGLAATFLL